MLEKDEIYLVENLNQAYNSLLEGKTKTDNPENIRKSVINDLFYIQKTSENTK